MKRIIKLTESDLRRMVMETINELDDIDINPFVDKKKDDPRLVKARPTTPSIEPDIFSKPFDPQEPPEGYTEEGDPNWVPRTAEECEVLPFH